MSSIRIISANTNALMQLGLKAVLMRGGGVEKFKEVADEQNLNRALATEHFGLIIFCPNEEAGFTQEKLAEMRGTRPELSILVISNIRSPQMVIDILQKGTQGYLTNSCDEHEILHAVFALAKGEKFFCNKVLDIVLNKHLYEGEEEDCEPTVLTKRETEITALLASGKTNKEVAAELNLSPHTVHTHRKNVMRKLNLRSASDITRYAMNTGLLDPAYP